MCEENWSKILYNWQLPFWRRSKYGDNNWSSVYDAEIHLNWVELKTQSISSSEEVPAWEEASEEEEYPEAPLGAWLINPRLDLRLRCKDFRYIFPFDFHLLPQILRLPNLKLISRNSPHFHSSPQRPRILNLAFAPSGLRACCSLGQSSALTPHPTCLS